MVNSKDSNFTLIDCEDPVLGKCLSVMWGRPEFDTYIKMLMDVGVSRKQFSAALLCALAAVKASHDKEFKYDK